MLGNQYCLGRPCSGKTRTKISKSHLGVPFSRAHRMSLSGDAVIFVSQGYAYLKFLGSWEAAHRLAYVYYHGPIATGEYVCLSNGDRLDCSEDNLKSMTPGEHNSFHKLPQIEELAA